MTLKTGPGAALAGTALSENDPGAGWTGPAVETLLRGFGWLCLAAVAAICILPVLLIVLGGFSEGEPINAFAPTLEPWARALESKHTIDSIVTSFVLSLRVPAAMLIAFFIAWYLARNDVFGKRAIMFSLWVGFFLPILPATLGWILLLDPNFGLVNAWLKNLPFVSGPAFDIYSLGGITWVHITLSTIPIMVILIEPAQRLIDASFEEASTMSGAGTLTTLRRVTVPLIAPTLLTAFIAGTIRSLEAFEVEQLLGLPADILVYSTRIYHLLRVIPPDAPQSMALSSFFLVIMFVLVLVYRVWLQRASMAATLTGRGAKLQPRQRTRGSYAVSAFLFLAVAVTIGLPFLMVLLSSFSRLFGFFHLPDPWTFGHWATVLEGDEFLRAVNQSLMTGAAVAIAGTTIYLGLAWFIARNAFPGKGALSLAIWMPWALPGVLLGTAFLVIFLNAPGLTIFYGTAVALVTVLIVQGLPFATHLFEASIGQVSRELEESSLMSGAGRLETILRITAPLVAPVVATVFVLSFMSAIKDISATVLVSTPDTFTLPLLMFTYATSGRLEVAAVVGVITVVIAMAMALLVTWIGDRAAVTR